MANNNFLSTFGFIFVLISIGHAVPTSKGDSPASLQNGYVAHSNDHHIAVSNGPSTSSVKEDVEVGQKEKIATINNEMSLLVKDAIDWAHHVGMVVRKSDQVGSSDLAQFAPFALFPSQVPRDLFHQAVGVQEVLTLLYFRASCDYQFLRDTLAEASGTDETLRKLMDIHEHVYQEGIKQPVSMVFQRADYMFHVNEDEDDEEHPYQLKQIEVNSGAVAGLLIQTTTELHRRVVSRAGLPVSKEFLPDNNPIGNVAHGLYLAWRQFGNPDAILVMVVSKVGSPNHFEQRYVEYEIERVSSGQIEVVRLPHTECAGRLRLADDHTLMLGNRVVGVVYFRVSHLATKDFDGDTFEGRRMIDRSTAIKCPSIGMLLANTKKVQQALAEPGVLEGFLPGMPKKVAAIRATFAGLWGLDNEDKETRAKIEDAIANPDRYVLKPNKEGGGHNFWGPDIAHQLKTLPRAKLAEHILMQKLKPMVSQNYFIKPSSEPEFGPVVTELGVFGALVGDASSGHVLYNRAQGHAMRTKWASAQEGGISMGAVNDSPYLV